MNLLSGALQQGLLYSILGMGVYLSFRILRIPDLTVDGTFALGGAVSAIFVVRGYPLLALLSALIAGGMAGMVTGLIQTKIGVTPILSGVLTMSGLYTINLAIQSGAPNISLLGSQTLFDSIPGMEKELSKYVIPLLFCSTILILLIVFFHTQSGLCIRAVGSNPAMSRSMSVDEGKTKILGLSMVNGLAALSGGLVVQYQGYADVSTGSGTMLAGLAGIILGEVIFRSGSIAKGLMSAAAGSVIYQVIMALAIWYNIFPAYTFKLVSSCLIILVLGLGYRQGKGKSDEFS